MPIRLLMRFGRFLSVFCTLILSAGAQAQLTDPNAATQILDQVSKISGSQLICEPVSAKKSERKKYTAESFAQVRCEELFSLGPPAWIRNSKAVGIFKKPENWRPVCSWAQLDQIRKANPKYTKTQLVLALNQDTPRFDQCGVPSKKKTKSKGASLESKPVSLDVTQRTQKLKDIEEIREKAAPACCGEDQECISLIKNVKIGFCEKDENSEEDSCLDTSTFYDPEFEDSRHWFREAKGAAATELEAIRKRAVGNFEIQSGTIIVSPYLGSGDDQVVYAHEFGHACSQLRRNLAIKRDSAAEFYEFIDEDECHISSFSKMAYHSLALDRGFNDQTFSCLNRKATEVKKAKYHKVGCVEGCEHSYLEESYADLFSSTVSKETEWIPDFIPEDMCNAVRDEEHMLASDIVGCMLQTPRVRSALERQTGCLK